MTHSKKIWSNLFDFEKNSSTENVTFERRARFGRGKTGNNSDYMIWLEKLACDGKEKDLGSCLSKGEYWGDHTCTHDKDVGVICQGKNGSFCRNT